jgi:hypothetical protein
MGLFLPGWRVYQPGCHPRQKAIKKQTLELSNARQYIAVNSDGSRLKERAEVCVLKALVNLHSKAVRAPQAGPCRAFDFHERQPGSVAIDSCCIFADEAENASRMGVNMLYGLDGAVICSRLDAGIARCNKTKN